jgi:hypothetical protein
VSANAGTSYGMDTGSNHWSGWVGTSLAAPTWAAATALIDASSAACLKTSAGFLNPTLYLYGAGSIYLNDITKGNNTNGDAAVHGAYPATKGYDLATGLGTPEAANLAQLLCATPPLWSPETTMPGSYNSAIAPAVASSGHTLYVVTTNRNGDIIYQTFNGTTWGAISEVKIGKNPVKTGYSPAIAVNGGKPSIAWTSSSHAVEVSTLSHGKWSAGVVVGKGKALSSRGPALTAGGGFLDVAWKGNSTDHVYVSLDTKKGWSAQLKVPGASSSARPALVYYSPVPSLVIAWLTSKNSIKYETLSIFGFGTVDTVPQAGTNASPALAVVGDRLYVAWKGRSTDKIFYDWQPDKQIFGTWSGQVSEPGALTHNSPAIAATGPTMYTVWLGASGKHLWFQFADVPN